MSHSMSKQKEIAEGKETLEAPDKAEIGRRLCHVIWCTW